MSKSDICFFLSYKVGTYPTYPHICHAFSPTLARRRLTRVSLHVNRLIMGGPYRWCPDQLIPLGEHFLNMKTAPIDVESYCFSIRLRVICSNLINWQSACRKVDQVIDIDPRQDHRTLAQLVNHNSTWKGRLTCKILEKTAQDGLRMGLIEYTENKWRIKGESSMLNGKKLASTQSLLYHNILFQRWGKPAAVNVMVRNMLVERTKKWTGTSNDEARKADANRIMTILFRYD